MKKVIIDVNIFKKEKIEKIMQSNIKNNKEVIKLYASEVLLSQRLPFLYENKLYKDYDFYVDFMKNYCENEIIDSAAEVICKELKSNFSWTQIYSKIRTENLYYHDESENKISQYDVKTAHQHKIETTKNIQSFLNEIKVDVFNVKNVILWETYCLNFVEKYNFAPMQMYNFLIRQKTYNSDTFIRLLKYWWRCSRVSATLYHFNPENASLEQFYRIAENQIPENSFAFRKFKAEDYVIDYALIQNHKVDTDTPNDTTYIAHMNNFDILLTDDGKTHDKFMKACFKHVYSDNSGKEILNLDEFLEKYSR